MKSAAALGAAALSSQAILARALAAQNSAQLPLVSSVQGTNYFEITQKAIELIGGMGRFVKPGSSVGLLVNAPSWWKRHGSHTQTDVVLATAKMAADAGAKKITLLLKLAPDFWDRSPRSADHKSLIASIADPSDQYIPKQIARGVTLKQAEMIKDLFESDVFIDIPIAKHHEGTHFTGCLKNMMGACNRKTNQFMHTGGGDKKNYEDVAFLSQCIADVNLVRKPDLCVVDATEFLLTGGPAGPGEIHKEQKVLAGTDPVLLDAHCVAFFNRKPEDILMIRMAVAHGIGTMDTTACELKTATLG
jgi:uncharacterized protein (DUF362 family)